MQKKNEINEEILKEIGNSLRGIAFGTVMIKINNSKIVQIEVTENKRFDNRWALEGGGGI